MHAALKLKRLKENVYVEITKSIKSLSPLNQGFTADIFLEMFRLFSANAFHKTSERLIGKGVHLFSKSNYYCFSRATIEV